MNGQALDLFGAGRYTLETENIPLIRKVTNLPTGGQTPFHCEVYFVNKTEQMAIRWGTDSKVQYLEPTYEGYGIIRRNGFLYLKDDRKILFRKPGDLTRSIEQIAPEELAAGMREILKQNLTADKDGLYRTLAAQCGVTRMGATVTETLDRALYLLKDSIVIEGDYISLR